MPVNTTVTVNIRAVITREFHLRMWLATRLIQLAGWVLGCGIKFEDDDLESRLE